MHAIVYKDPGSHGGRIVRIEFKILDIQTAFGVGFVVAIVAVQVQKEANWLRDL